MATNPWKCSACRTVVFIPDDKGISGGVCTQECRGCKGEIGKMSTEEEEAVRETMAARGIGELPWLTLVFQQHTAGAEGDDEIPFPPHIGTMSDVAEGAPRSPDAAAEPDDPPMTLGEWVMFGPRSAVSRG